MNYQELVAAAKSYADRSDVEVDSNIDVFIRMAEARINRSLKVAEQTHRAFTATVEGREFYTLPPDYNGMRVVHFNTSGVDEADSKVIQLHHVTPERIADMQEDGCDDDYYYALINNQIQIHNKLPGSGTIEMVFYRKVPPLTNENSNNWLSVDYPDIYLSGICGEIELFVKNYDSARLWDDRMTRAIGEISDNDMTNRWSGNSLQIRLG